eukprot:COSAG03_NODE_1141_length_4735_cov_28.552416_1_plen_63_part_00
MTSDCFGSASAHVESESEADSDLSRAELRVLMNQAHACFIRVTKALAYAFDSTAANAIQTYK